MKASALRRRLLPYRCAVLAVPLLAAAIWPRHSPPPVPEARVAVNLLGGDGQDLSGFERATGPRPFHFPADHGPHPTFRSEWWYLTGQLTETSAAGVVHHFGYQFTIFRQALAPGKPERRSAWATHQVYLGHLAVTDIDNHRFAAAEQIAREGLGLAGAAAQPFHVWVEGWDMRGQAAELFPLQLHAQGTTGDGHPLGLDFTVQAGRGPILQGDRGLSAKGPQRGNASYYLSFTRLPTSGRITLDQQSLAVQGESWLDREWSTSALGPAVAGWDWAGLSLDDGRDVMVFRLRQRDGSSAPQSRATVISADGTTRSFAPSQFSWEPEGIWHSPAGTAYPARMNLRLPEARLDLQLVPLVADQELRLSIRYWEGAVEVRERPGSKVHGRGYLELTGY